MAKKTKYHFLSIRKATGGLRLLPLPGQTLGRGPLSPNVIVQDYEGYTVIRNAKAKGAEGEVFFTTTLAKGSHSYKAKDIYPLKGNNDIFYQEAQQEYERLTATP